MRTRVARAVQPHERMVQRWTALAVAMLLAASPLGAQAPADTASDARAHERAHASAHEDVRRAIVAALVLGGAMALDRPMRTAIRGRGEDPPLVHALSSTGDALGTASHLVPAMGAALVVAAADRSRVRELDVLDAVAGYAAADLTEGALKSAVGRERPHVSGEPFRFHPFTGRGDYHSFPSAHLAHVTALATAAALESRESWVRDAGVAATVLVAWQRVHADQHWTSDTIAGAMVGHWMSELVVRALRREQHRR